MRLETAAIVAKNLREGPYPLNWFLDRVPRFPGHKRPRDVARVYDPTVTPEALFVPDYAHHFPSLIVQLNGEVEMTPEKLTYPDRFGTVTLAIKYLTDKADPVEAYQETEYTLRALVFWLDWFNALATQDVRNHDANEVQVWAMTGLAFGEYHEEIGSGRVTGVAVCDFYVRDVYQSFVV